MPTEFGIRKNRDGNNLRDLHVELRERVRRLFALAESAGLGELMVYSGARTYAHQLSLYKAYLARNRSHPIVANPDRGFGSKHQVRPAARYKHGNLPARRDAAFAVDIQWTDRRRPTKHERAELKRLAGVVGLVATVASEWWHFEPAKSTQLFALAGLGWRGPDIVQLQTTLNNKFDAGLVVDGDYGPRTYGAVGEFQKQAGLAVTGDWTHSDQQALFQATPKDSARPTPPVVQDFNPDRAKQPSKEPAIPAQRRNVPDVDGIDENPTQWKTNRLVRSRAISAGNKIDQAEALIAEARESIAEIGKLVYHEQND